MFNIFAKTIISALVGFSVLTTAVQAQALNLTSSQWIWTREASPEVPSGHRAFRKSFDATFFKFPSTVEVLISVDNGYTLYVNGVEAGTAEGWQQAQYYCVDVSAIRNVLIAVDAYNLFDAAGLIASVRVNYEIGDPDVFISDSSWVFNLTVPEGFEDPSFDDSAWPEAVGEGLYGTGVWGRIGIPTASQQVCNASTI